MKKKPLLILVSGAPATGKTTLARKLSDYFKAPYFSADEIKETISEWVVGRKNRKLYEKVCNASYDIFYKNIKKILSISGVCIAEALFIKELAEPKIREIQKKFNCRILQIYLKADEKIATKRYDLRHGKGKRHKSHVPKMSIGLKKYGGYDNLIKKARLEIAKTIEIDTNNLKKIDYKEIFNKIEKIL